ncbi:hypothetical protein D3C85_1731160 [compost metagenome]
MTFLAIAVLNLTAFRLGDSYIIPAVSGLDVADVGGVGLDVEHNRHTGRASDNDVAGWVGSLERFQTCYVGFRVFNRGFDVLYSFWFDFHGFCLLVDVL